MHVQLTVGFETDCLRVIDRMEGVTPTLHCKTQ